MAKRKRICIDGEVVDVGTKDTLADVVPADVNSVVTFDGKLVPKSRFANVPVPEGFDTTLSRINKG